MSEKRKPDWVFVAQLQGKPGKKTISFKLKIELFHVSKWATQTRRGVGWKPSSIRFFQLDVYRVRVNGKWYKGNNEDPLTMSQFFSIFRRQITHVVSKTRGK